MKKRPLCFILMAFLFVQSLWQVPHKVPATSIFSQNLSIKSMTLCGQVYKKEIQEEYQILYLKNNSITYQDHSYQESKIIAYDDSFHKIKIGQYIHLIGDGKAFEVAKNPGNFDAKFYYAKNKIYGAIWNVKIITVKGEEHTLKEKLFSFRESWEKMLQEKLGYEKGSLLCAILLNEKADLSEETKELYQKNGYGHILAISGLHISFIGVGIFQALRKLGARYGVSSLISILVLTLYVLMIGFSVSIFRAYVMLLFRIGAELTGRVYDMLTAVFVSAALLVIYEPLYLQDAAFQLSHGAILAIILVAPAIRQYIGKEGRLAEVLYGSLAIQITLLPITLWWYYEISIYSILWNLIVIPLMSVLMTLGIFGSFMPLKIVWFSGCSIILSVFEWIGKIGNEMFGSRLVLGRPSYVAVIIFYIWILILVMLAKYKKRFCKWMFWSFWIVGLLFIKFPNGELEITMLDVGQGDCIFIQGPRGKSYLVDGGSSDVSQVGKYRIESFLKYKGVNSLDYVFISHGDSDHYNGIEEILERKVYSVRIENLVFPGNYLRDKELIELAELAKTSGVKVRCMKQGQFVEEGKMRLSCVQPGAKENELEGNAGSMVLDLRYKDFAMLFTGDVEGEGENHLIENLNHSYQVLKVSHHGSKNSTSEQLLKVVRPKLALVSAGENNSYGHPHKEVIERLERHGCRILCTTQEGAIRLKTKGNTLTF